MTQQEMEAKVKEIFSDKDYVTGLINLETPEDVQKSLAEKGLDLTVDQIKKIRDLALKSQDQEITDDELEKVSGGCGAGVVVSIVASVVGCLFGAASIVDNHCKW